MIADPPVIGRVSKGTERPFWSVMIPTFNCAHFLRETLNSVLDQDPGPERMHIEVVDDCSTKDDPEAVVRELAGDRVHFYRQPRNQGAIGTFNTCAERSRGRWVHILHGDDTVRPGFYERAERAILSSPEIGAVFCRYIYMFEDGHWQHLSELESRRPAVLGGEFLHRMLLTNQIMFPSMVVRREVYETLGGFRPQLVHCADWDMWLRTTMHYPVFYEPEPLACYRVHSGADTARLVKSGENVADERRFCDLVTSYVPPEEKRNVYRKSRRAAAVRAIRRAQDLWRKGHHDTARVQLREAVRTSRDLPVIMHLVRVAAWAAVREPTTSPSAQDLKPAVRRSDAR